MLELPEEHELIGLFECEPKLLDPTDTPWCYNELLFDTTRGEDRLKVSIYPSFGEFKLDWARAGRQLLKLKITDLDSFNKSRQSPNFQQK